MTIRFGYWMFVVTSSNYSAKPPALITVQSFRLSL